MYHCSHTSSARTLCRICQGFSLASGTSLWRYDTWQLTVSFWNNISLFELHVHQAFSQMGIQASYGWPLTVLKKIIYFLYVALWIFHLSRRYSVFWTANFQFVAKSLNDVHSKQFVLYPVKQKCLLTYLSFHFSLKKNSVSSFFLKNSWIKKMFKSWSLSVKSLNIASETIEGEGHSGKHNYILFVKC